MELFKKGQIVTDGIGDFEVQAVFGVECELRVLLLDLSTGCETLLSAQELNQFSTVLESATLIGEYGGDYAVEEKDEFGNTRWTDSDE